MPEKTPRSQAGKTPGRATEKTPRDASDQTRGAAPGTAPTRPGQAPWSPRRKAAVTTGGIASAIAIIVAAVFGVNLAADQRPTDEGGAATHTTPAASAAQTRAPDRGTAAPGQTAARYELSAGGAVFGRDPSIPEGVTVCAGRGRSSVVEEYSRPARPELSVPAATTRLSCGAADSFGWLHIADGHEGDFGRIADQIGVPWAEVARFAVREAVEHPVDVRAYKGDIVDYVTELRVTDTKTGRTLGTYTVLVGVGLKGDEVITAYPKG